MMVNDDDDDDDWAVTILGVEKSMMAGRHS